MNRLDFDILVDVEYADRAWVSADMRLVRRDELAAVQVIRRLAVVSDRKRIFAFTASRCERAARLQKRVRGLVVVAELKIVRRGEPSSGKVDGVHFGATNPVGIGSAIPREQLEDAHFAA